jgi:hypothetical protein
MTKVTAQLSNSFDGCYAGPMDPRDPHDAAGWMQGPEAPRFSRVTRWVTDATGWRERQGYAGGERSINSDIIEETFAAAGAYVMGRRMFDGGEIPWGDTPPFRAPVFVVTHRPRATLQREGGTSFTFVTGGIEQAAALPARRPAARTWPSPAAGPCCGRSSGPACSSSSGCTSRRWCLIDEATSTSCRAASATAPACTTSRMGPCASCRTWVGDDPNASTNLRFRTAYEH